MQQAVSIICVSSIDSLHHLLLSQTTFAMAQEGKRHPPNSGKPRTKGAESRSKHAKPAQDKKVKGQGKAKGKDVLREQVLSMGGDNADLELLEGVKEDDQMELGDEAADVSIVQSLSEGTYLRHTTRLP